MSRQTIGEREKKANNNENLNNPPKRHKMENKINKEEQKQKSC